MCIKKINEIKIKLENLLISITEGSNFPEEHNKNIKNEIKIINKEINSFYLNYKEKK